MADWAAAAWDLLHAWRLDPVLERAGGGQLDYRALLDWCRSYRERLDAHGWTDRAELEKRLAAEPPRGVSPAIMTDLAESHPAGEKLLTNLQSAGVTIGTKPRRSFKGANAPRASQTPSMSFAQHSSSASVSLQQHRVRAWPSWSPGSPNAKAKFRD